MAGIIQIRYNFKTKRWTAKPDFAHPAWGWKENAPSADAADSSTAIYNLCDLLPEDMAHSVQLACPERVYRSPEYEWMSDKCIEVDGHCPCRKEWWDRRLKYMQLTNKSTKQYYGHSIHLGKGSKG